MDSKKATLVGLTAVFLWSLIVALIKEVSNHFGPIGGAALMYSLASIFLLISFGWTHLKEFPLKYLIWGILLFVSYEICLSLSIGYSTNSRQAIEIGMVNYLWPTVTILFSIIFNKQKANFLIFPGACLSIIGICLVLGGDEGFSFKEMISNVQNNPFSYGLALLGVFLWAAYCTLTARSANGKNGITLFFILVSMVLWGKWTLSGDVSPHFDLTSITYLVLCFFYGHWVWCMECRYYAWKYYFISNCFLLYSRIFSNSFGDSFKYPINVKLLARGFNGVLRFFNLLDSN